MIRLTSPRVLLALGLLAACGGGALQAQRSSTSMTIAARSLLDSLSDSQREQATFPFDSSERMRWNFIPDEMFPRNGLPLKAMTPPQRELARALLRTGLSERGYTTYAQIIQLENILKTLEGERFVRDPDAYRFSVFGDPTPQGTWGWRVDGHHVSLHFSVVKGTAVASTPSFAGSNPAEVREGPQKGQRTLGALEDAGRALVTALSAQQRKTAVIEEEAPNEIATRNTLDIDPLSPAGLKASDMSDSQRALLMELIDAYAGMMATDIAADRLVKIRTAGIENVAFAWAGPLDRGAKHYYRVQGPTFLIEYDNAQNDGNHVHSVWRDFRGDFGRDLLRDHLRASLH